MAAVVRKQTNVTGVSIRRAVVRNGDAHFVRAWSFSSGAVDSHTDNGWGMSETEHGVG